MSTAPSTIPVIELNDGNVIPQLGFGVFQIPPEETAEAVSTALEIGYRHIDTAEMYRNERGVGEAVRASGVDRSEVFITSKLNNGYHRPDDARRAFERTLTELDTDYVDLFLIHWPLPTRYDGDYVSTWRTLEEFKDDGRARSIGVSNFQVPHLQRVLADGVVSPAVNQIELHPYLLNDDVRAFGEEHGIATEAWSPIAKGEVIDDPVVRAIADGLARAGGPALAYPAPEHRLPEVDGAVAHQGELRAVRLRARLERRRTARDARSGRRRPDRAEPGHVRPRSELRSGPTPLPLSALGCRIAYPIRISPPRCGVTTSMLR
jgi:2,5-diketo-D-gluconate reductase A